MLPSEDVKFYPSFFPSTSFYSPKGFASILERRIGRDTSAAELFIPQPMKVLAAQSHLKEKLHILAKLTNGWDGPNSLKPHQGAISIAQTVVDIMARRNGSLLTGTDATPDSNGTVSLDWESSFGSAHIEFGATRHAGIISETFGRTQNFGGLNPDFNLSYLSLIEKTLFPYQNGFENSAFIVGKISYSVAS